METVLLILAALWIAFLIWRNYQLERRWRCLRYCWHMMSDFAGENAKADDSTFAIAWWQNVLNEQAGLMRRFGAPILTPHQIEEYEAALIERQIMPLREHWAR